MSAFSPRKNLITIEILKYSGSLLLSCIPVLTWAATAAPEITQLDTIKVQAESSSGYIGTQTASTLRGKQKNLESSQTVNVVSKQYVKDYVPANLDNALTQVSGITQGNTLGGTQDTVMKRGFGDNRDGSITVNGMPIVQGRTMNAAVEQVEVLKGPASLLYGIMDPGGVVNVVTKKPEMTQKTEMAIYGSSFAAGKNGLGASLDTTGAINDSNFAYRFIVDHSDADYWRNFGNLKQTLIAPSVAWDNGQTKVNLSYQYRHFDVPFDRSTIFDPNTKKALPISKYQRLDEAFNQMKGEDHLAQLLVDHQINDTWSVHFGYTYNYETYDANQLRVTSLDTKNHTVKRRTDATLNAESVDSNAQAYLNGSINLLGLKHDIQIGSDIEYRKYFRPDMVRGDTSTLDYLNPDFGTVEASRNIVASDSDQTDKLHTYGFYLQDAIHLNEKWIAVLGGRYLHYQQTAGRSRPFKENTNTNDDAWLPHAGLVYQWNDQFSLYGSYTESLKPNSSIAPLGGNAVIDSDVRPEQAKSYELGAKYEFNDRIKANFALYDIKKRNVLAKITNSSTKEVELHTTGAVRSTGAELDLTGRLNDQLDATLTYAYTDAKVTEDETGLQGNRLNNVARDTASLALAYNYGELYNGNLRLGLSGNYVGKRAGDSENTFDLPEYMLANAFISYDTTIAKQAVNFQFNLNNIFDKTYYTASVNNLAVSQGDSRQAVLRATFKF
ncbi:TonB-dependent siderophore receptor [Acinetobacter vivianii]|uniref:TonB-dependent siderophore receptor n=1 Tax=Acinetobacter vivianii TaxID=1776742 RepID=UPI002DBB793D|nr:TonB-dependent siderophore receptor [Acinetobacter vivianii]MEB6478183.1 TonB-dependent siderophore receptor [Acinetobacter vivianii]MEB6657986.1 TonB-dependent siderophore receptor [Acinetobacter vivianii]